MERKKLNAIALGNIRIDDFFWNKYTRLVTKQIIPYQWDALNDRVEDAEPSHCITNFEIAAELREGNFEGAVFQDTDLAKWLEAVAYSLSYEKNQALEQCADDVIRLIGHAQQKDGYLDTYFIIKEPDKKFVNLREGHELYTAGHFMEAAVAYYQVTGKDKFLRIMRRVADLICKVFHEESHINAVPGHQEVEIGLVKMYRATGEKRYLEMAKEFIERRGQEPNYLEHEHEKENWPDIFKDPLPFLKEYSQCHKPVREQTTAEGHAVRATYMYCAMADLAYEYQDESLLKACENLYDNITKKRMYITGGIGSSGMYERFTTDYDLPNDSNYAESCASIGLALFCRRMLEITGEEKYADTMECALMNTVLAGIAMDGKSFFYVNPLEVWPKNCLDHSSMAHVKPVRQKWFGCACCPPNIARTLASLGEYVASEGENQLQINLFAAGTIETMWNDVPVTVTVDTKFPFKGEVTFHVTMEKDTTGTLSIRIPSYSKHRSLWKNGSEIDFKVEKGFTKLEITDRETEISFHFDMPARFVYANPQVRADAGKVAIVKGPLVYCLEEEDNGGNLAGIYVDTKSEITEQFDETLLGGTMTLRVNGKRLEAEEWTEDVLYSKKKVSSKDVTLKLIPYCYWDNRVPGEMQVWMKQCM